MISLSCAGICGEKNFRCLGLLASFQNPVSPLFVIPIGPTGPQCPGELVFPAPGRPLCGCFPQSGLSHQLFWLESALVNLGHAQALLLPSTLLSLIHISEPTRLG